MHAPCLSAAESCPFPRIANAVNCALFWLANDQLWRKSHCAKSHLHSLLPIGSGSVSVLLNSEGLCAYVWLPGQSQDHEIGLLKYFWLDPQMTWNLSLRWNRTLASQISCSYSLPVFYCSLYKWAAAFRECSLNHKTKYKEVWIPFALETMLIWWLLVISPNFHFKIAQNSPLFRNDGWLMQC